MGLGRIIHQIIRNAPLAFGSGLGMAFAAKAVYKGGLLAISPFRQKVCEIRAGHLEHKVAKSMDDIPEEIYTTDWKNEDDLKAAIKKAGFRLTEKIDSPAEIKEEELQEVLREFQPSVEVPTTRWELYKLLKKILGGVSGAISNKASKEAKVSKELSKKALEKILEEVLEETPKKTLEVVSRDVLKKILMEVNSRDEKEAKRGSITGDFGDMKFAGSIGKVVYFYNQFKRESDEEELREILEKFRPNVKIPTTRWERYKAVKNIAESFEELSRKEFEYGNVFFVDRPFVPEKAESHGTEQRFVVTGKDRSDFFIRANAPTLVYLYNQFKPDALRELTLPIAEKADEADEHGREGVEILVEAATTYSPWKVVGNGLLAVTTLTAFLGINVLWRGIIR